jgi:hypothetical protein
LKQNPVIVMEEVSDLKKIAEVAEKVAVASQLLE